MFGSPEPWLGETRWMLSSDVYTSSVRAVAVDEGHVICLWEALFHFFIAFKNHLCISAYKQSFINIGDVPKLCV